MGLPSMIVALHRSASAGLQTITFLGACAAAEMHTRKRSNAVFISVDLAKSIGSQDLPALARETDLFRILPDWQRSRLNGQKARSKDTLVADLQVAPE